MKHLFTYALHVYAHNTGLVCKCKTANIAKDDITLQHMAKMSLCCEVISSFVTFAVLHLRVNSLQRLFRTTSTKFFLIFAVFLHDLASAYQISPKRNNSRQSYDVISISKILKIVAIELEILRI